MTNPELEQCQPTIRTANIEDAEAIAKIYKKVWLDTYPNEEYGISRKLIEQKVKDWASPQHIELWKNQIESQGQQRINIVAESNSRVIGHTNCTKAIEGPNRVKSFYVLPEYHGTGVAMQMMQECLVWLGRDKDIVLEVAKYNKKAIRFYEKNGFIVVGDGNNPFARLNEQIKIPEYSMLLGAEQK